MHCIMALKIGVKFALRKCFADQLGIGIRSERPIEPAGSHRSELRIAGKAIRNDLNVTASTFFIEVIRGVSQINCV